MAKKSSAGVEAEHHIVGVRLRVLGEGNLLLSLQDYSNIQTQNLIPLVMSTATRIEPTRLSNFQSQRTRLVGTVDEMDEWFGIRRIIVYAKPVAIEYPM